ncbi:hypothetical protein HYDPIDRAFT_167667 [Hydnomerulius pinastri MD-312]|uniref:Uncharacterized protein n=1 Tax=Hydnomerulius pinastri MD-312 TaxID=994086 RepID=A0A0C9WFJ5_9AGAM|nr:hypothetical protein HYDPIDRAFT_167667 [Hydnomerulius pinastri MD-312]
MPPKRRAPTKKKTDEERFQERGQTSQLYSDRYKQMDPNLPVFKEVLKPTIDAQRRIEMRLRAFLPKIPDVLERHGVQSFDDLLKPGAPMLDRDYIVDVSEGKFTDRITIKTLVNNVAIFLSAYKRLTAQSISKDDSQALFNYAKGECATTYGLTTHVRGKPIADGVDVRFLQKELWSEKDPIVSTRMRIQVSAFIGLSAATASRPGNIVESSCWKGSNEALLYEDLVFTILPHVDLGLSSDASLTNPPLASEGDLPGNSSPHKCESAKLVLKVRFRLLKGHRKEEGYYSEIVFDQEKLEELGLCLVTSFLLMALQDEAFDVVRDLDDLERLMAGATAPIKLSIKDSAKKTPVLRNYQGRTKNISDTAALTYNALYFQLAKLGMRAGFEERLNPYCLRRMGANNMDESDAITPEQRRQSQLTTTMIENVQSTSYLSPLVRADLMGVAMGRQESLDAVRFPSDLLQAIGRMSLSADKEAPIALSVEATAHIWKLPELQELLSIQDKAKLACFAVHGTRIEDAKDSAEGAVYRAAYNEPTGPSSEEPISFLPDAAQEEQLENLDLRSRFEELGHIDLNNMTGGDCADILEGGATEHLISVLMEGDDHDNLPVSGPVGGSSLSKKAAQRVQTKVDVEYNPARHYPPNIVQQLFGGTRDDDKLVTRISAWRQLIALPECREIPKTDYDSLYYPDNAPTEDMSCPYENCKKKDLTHKTASQRAIHLHQCDTAQRQELADARLESTTLFPTVCCWERCNRHNDGDFEDNCIHISQHVHNELKRASGGAGGTCGLNDCGYVFGPHFQEGFAHVREEHLLPCSPKGFYNDSGLKTHIARNHHEYLDDLMKSGTHTGLLCPSAACTAPDQPYSSLLEFYNHLVAAHKIAFAGKRGKLSDGSLPLLQSLEPIEDEIPERLKKRQAVGTLNQDCPSIPFLSSPSKSEGKEAQSSKLVQEPKGECVIRNQHSALAIARP